MPFNVLTKRRYTRENALDRAYASFNANRNSNGQNSWLAGVGGTLLEGHNLSYHVSQGDTSNNGYTGSATANWQAAYGTLGVGYNYDRDQHDVNWQLSGGVVGHENGITLSQPLGDTNVLIKAPGAGGVRIENQTGILTDWRGYAVMPYATVYRITVSRLIPIRWGIPSMLKKILAALCRRKARWFVPILIPA